MRGPNFIDFGKRPDFTPASHVLLETGINAGIGGSVFRSPMMLDNLRKPVSGKVIFEVMCSIRASPWCSEMENPQPIPTIVGIRGRFDRQGNNGQPSG